MFCVDAKLVKKLHGWCSSTLQRPSILGEIHKKMIYLLNVNYRPQVCIILYIVSKLLVFVDWNMAMGEPNLKIRVQTTILEGTLWHTKVTVEIVSGVEAGLFTVPEKKVGVFLKLFISNATQP